MQQGIDPVPSTSCAVPLLPSTTIRPKVALIFAEDSLLRLTPDAVIAPMSPIVFINDLLSLALTLLSFH